jgi:hypothetical protein
MRKIFPVCCASAIEAVARKTIASDQIEIFVIIGLAPVISLTPSACSVPSLASFLLALASLPPPHPLPLVELLEKPPTLLSPSLSVSAVQNHRVQRLGRSRPETQACRSPASTRAKSCEDKRPRFVLIICLSTASNLETLTVLGYRNPTARHARIG